MPETKQVGFRCHGPDQQRLGPAADSLDPGAEGPPCFTGEATENRVAILRPALMEEEGEAGFQLQEEVGPPTLIHTHHHSQKWPLLCPSGCPRGNGLRFEVCRPA